MPLRHGKFEQIDVGALLNIFEQRRAFDFARLDGLNLFYLLAPPLDEVEGAELWIDAQGQRQPLQRRQQINRYSMTGRILFDLVEDNRRAGLRTLVDQFRQRRQLQFPMGVVDGHQLTEFIDII